MTVILLNSAGINENNEPLFEYQCGCGKIFVHPEFKVGRGKIKTCGCGTRKNRWLDKKGAKSRTYNSNLIDTPFSNLIVLNLKEYNKFGEQIWVCKCICGNIIEVSRRQLLKGYKRSCGCSLRATAWNANFIGDISANQWYHITQSAKKRKIEFILTREEAWQKFLDQNRKCIYSGVELSFSPTGFKGKIKTTASIDRIDNNGIYEVKNIQWVHKIVNRMKWMCTEPEFFEWVKLIYKNCNIK